MDINRCLLALLIAVSPEIIGHSANFEFAPDDVGACVFLQMPDKANECHDNVRYDVCYKDAKDSGAPFKHYKDKKCSDIKY